MAVANGHTEIVDLLLKKGASADSQDRKGRSSLVVAYENDMSDIFEALLTNGANPNVVYDKMTLLSAIVLEEADA